MTLRMRVGLKIAITIGVVTNFSAFNSHAANNIPASCRAIIKKGLYVVRRTETNPKEVLNLGWRPIDLVNLAFPGDTAVNLVRPVPESYVSVTLSTLLDLQKANRQLRDVYRKQNTELVHNREELDAGAGVVHRQLDLYLRNIGVEFFNRIDARSGRPFTYVSLRGRHPLNRWARALYFEHNLHTVFSGRELRIEQEFLHVPPMIFNLPNPVTHLITQMSGLLAQGYQTPIAYIDIDSTKLQHMQLSDGRRYLLDWNTLLNQDIRVNFRPGTKSPDALGESVQVRQRVHSLMGYLKTLPADMRESARSSIIFHAKAKQPLLFAAFERNGKWQELWPRDFGLPFLHKADAYEDYLVRVLKDDTFRRKTKDEDVIRFHVIIGSEVAEPVGMLDLEYFHDIRTKIEINATDRKGPRVEVSFAKVSIHDRVPLIFEPLSVTLKNDSRR